jgi:hypothetical protein
VSGGNIHAMLGCRFEFGGHEAEFGKGWDYRILYLVFGQGHWNRSFLKEPTTFFPVFGSVTIFLFAPLSQQVVS